MTSDMIESFGIPWCFRADSAKMAKKGRAFIINLDDSTGRGTHWVAARLFGDTLYYADPFGTILNGWPPAELETTGSKKIVNRIAFQRPSTSLCGYYSILFAKAMDEIKEPLSRDQFEWLLLGAIT